jgi:hypothetical protein
MGAVQESQTTSELSRAGNAPAIPVAPRAGRLQDPL